MVKEKKSPLIEMTILMPCLNEEDTIEICITKAKKFLVQNFINGEILIADNGSTDGSIQKATALGARVINVIEKGYGSALIEGIKYSHGQYIIMGDSDNTYDFSRLNEFINKLNDGYDLVMGNRFKGGITQGAMPLLHRYVGNPILSTIGKLFFKSPCSDFHCGLRAFKRESILKLDLRTLGMEFASEMVAKASLYHLRITEIPITLSPSIKNRQAHLRTWSDGWRHLRFMLLYSPDWLFLYPGTFLIILGTLLSIRITIAPFRIFNLNLDIHTLLVSCVMIMIGYQTVIFAFSSKIYAFIEGLYPPSQKFFNLFNKFNLEKGLITGLGLCLLGVTGLLLALFVWRIHDFGTLDAQHTMRIVIPSVTFLALGVQTIFSSFFFSVLGLRRK